MVVVAVVVFFGVPTLTQVERVRHRGLWGWYLYRSHGVGVVDLKYEVIDRAAPIPLNRARALGAAGIYDLPRKTRAPRVKNLMSQTDRVCRFVAQTYGPSATLTLNARVSGWMGWESVANELQDVCGEGRPSLVRATKNIRLHSTKRWIKLEKWLAGESAP
jgi:hypothetical protein